MTIAKVEPLLTARALRGPFDYRLPPELSAVAVGDVLRVPFGRQRPLGVVVDLAETSSLPDERLAEPLEALDAGTPPELVALGLRVAREYCSTPARGLELAMAPGLRRLAARDRRNRPSAARIAEVGASIGPVELTAEQRAAVAAGRAAMDGSGPRELLLHGVTGSGKTEVYLALAADAAQRSCTTLVLVPEIAITPQTVSRFRARFGDRVALLHSGLAAGERRREWERLRDGGATICVGPRSAVFAPLADLGLVVIDEEHDSAYKQDSDPRYDAREVARWRAQDAGAALIAGTATPRPESWLEFEHVELRERADGAALPPVEVLDMRGRGGRAGPLHPATRAALAELADVGGKAIVLLNRRGWAPFLSCRECGATFECPHCDVSLVLHRADKRLRCHHCGHTEPDPESCGECGSVSLTRQGIGTQRAAEAIGSAVGELPVFRLDGDSAAGAGAHASILRDFQDSSAGVLLGTQMVAKGHDFPDVTLACVLDADASLRFPDFRAEERTFALIAQLAGRSGRGPGGGRVIVQTLAPDAPAIVSAACHDAAGFLGGELERRRDLGYPPFSHLARVELSGADPSRLRTVAGAIADRARKALPGEAELLGPAPMMRIRGRHRSQIVVRSPDRETAVAALRTAVEEAAAARQTRGVKLAVDVDPQ